MFAVPRKAGRSFKPQKMMDQPLKAIRSMRAKTLAPAINDQFNCTNSVVKPRRSLRRESLFLSLDLAALDSVALQPHAA
jgi:hypothetical protein